MSKEILDKIIGRVKQVPLYLHSTRVGMIAVDIGEYMDFSGDKLKTLESAAILHDVGKIMLSDKIINKNTNLSPEEWEEIKKHPFLGASIVKPFCPLAVPGILYHHEKYAGGGYPMGAKGNDIPLEARIISIADSFDSLRTHQSYRGLYNIKDVLLMIEAESGRSFFPDVVMLFRRLLFDKLKSNPDKNKLWGNGKHTY